MCMVTLKPISSHFVVHQFCNYLNTCGFETYYSLEIPIWQQLSKIERMNLSIEIGSKLSSTILR